jgi:hypothetical protein
MMFYWAPQGGLFPAPARGRLLHVPHLLVATGRRGGGTSRSIEGATSEYSREPADTLIPARLPVLGTAGQTEMEVPTLPHR